MFLRLVAAALLLWATGAFAQNTTVTFEWDAATGSPTGYKVYCGSATNPVSYATPVDAGNVTQYDVVLANNLEYYCAVTAYNADGESGPSNEVHLTAPPSFIIIGELSCYEC